MKLVRESIGDVLKGKSKEEIIPGEELVVFKPTNPEKGMGTSLSGEVSTSYKRLVDLFGEPEDYTEDGYKVAYTWTVEDNKGRVATIYDWKATTMYDGDGYSPEELKELPSFTWHIGSGEGGYTPSWLKDVTGEEEKSGTIAKDLVNFIYFYES